MSLHTYNDPEHAEIEKLKIKKKLKKKCWIELSAGV
jgi:hypothetical protein